MTIKNWLSGVAALCMAVSLPPVAFAQEGELDDITVAAATTGLVYTAVYVAQDQGIFRDHGLNVELVTISGNGAPNAVLAGSVDFALFTASALARAASRGQRMLAIANLLDMPMMDVVLRSDLAEDAAFDPDQPLEERAAVLRGKTIAVNGINSNGHVFLKLVAARAGVDPERELTVVPLGSASLLAALETKSIDGFVASLPWPVAATQAGAAVQLVGYPYAELPEMVPFAYDIVATRPNYCEERRTICEKMGKALVAATKYIEQNREETMGVLRARFPGVEEDALLASLDIIIAATPQPPIVVEEALAKPEAMAINAGVVDPSERVTSFGELYTNEFVE